MVVNGLELIKTIAKPVNGTRSSIGKFPTEKRDYLFRSFIFSGNFPVERTEKSCSMPFTTQLEFPEFLGKWKTPQLALGIL